MLLDELTSIIMFSRLTNIPQCILELVLNSLNANASSVAVRVNLTGRKIQVVDNGTGMCKCALRNVAEYNFKCAYKIQTPSLHLEKTGALSSIRQKCSALVVTSRYDNSMTTYTKVFRYRHRSELLKTENRPSRGTTVTVYGFHEIPCDCKSTISEICILITNVALTNLKVSFSIRDDEHQKIVLKIGKPHAPLQIFKLLYGQKILPGSIWYIKDRVAHGIKFSSYIMLAESHAKISRRFILNGRPVICPLIFDFISNILAKVINSSLELQALKSGTVASCFITCSISKFIVTLQNSINNLLFNRMYGSIDHSVPNYTHSKSLGTKSNLSEIIHTNEDINIVNKCDEFTQVTTSYKVVNEDYISINSDWSNWTYHDNHMEDPLPNKNPTYMKKSYDFVPKNLQTLLKYANVKLTKATFSNNCDQKSILPECVKPPSIGNMFIQDMKVRSCKFLQGFCNFTLRKESIIQTKILRQVNNELIAGITVQDNVKLLLMMDQHAIDERIRYESLLCQYRTLDQKKLLSFDLEIPLIIKMPTIACLLLSANQALLENYGLKLTVINAEVTSIRSVPKCLAKNFWHRDHLKLEVAVQNLLYEIVKNLESGNVVNNMPLTIHHAVATEACHGAIKFGDVLSFEQCVRLVESLKDIKCPNRCAHGRPSVIPIIQLLALEKRPCKNIKKKLNLSSLKKYGRIRKQ